MYRRTHYIILITQEACVTLPLMAPEMLVYIPRGEVHLPTGSPEGCEHIVKKHVNRVIKQAQKMHILGSNDSNVLPLTWRS
jgi:hypothetical protein